MEKPLNHQIQLNYLELPETKILILNGIYKIFITKANNKTKSLFRIRKFLNLEQVEVLAEAYISSNFRYCPLISMLCGKMTDNLIVKTHMIQKHDHKHDHMRTITFKWEKENP